MYRRRLLRSPLPYDVRRHRVLAYILLGLFLALLLYHSVVIRDRYELWPYVPRPRYKDKELVFAATSSSNMDWVAEELGSWPANIYRSDDKEAPLTVPENKGNEAMAFLTFVSATALYGRILRRARYMIDRYSSLPDVSVFLHDARYQWHNDNPSNGMRTLTTGPADSPRCRYLNQRS